MPDTSLFDYDPAAPFGLEVVSTHSDDAVTLQDITYASPKGGKVTAYLIAPGGNGPYAGLVFVHWGQGNREEFVDEAKTLAAKGVVSLCLDAPFARPEYAKVQQPDLASEAIHCIIDVRRGLDLLNALPTVDARLGYVGHSYGATFGGILAGVEQRVNAYVLMGGVPSLVDHYRSSTHPMIVQARESTSPEVWKQYLAPMTPLDPIHYIGHAAPAALFFQFASHDEFVTEQESMRYWQAASQPKHMKWYDCRHEFNAEARQDRDSWLGEQLNIAG